jgi:hypothetical protein
MISTPYGECELVAINFAYGVRVRLPRTGIRVWFAFREIGWRQY